MAKYSFELKLEAVLAYLEGKDSLRKIASQFNINLFPLRNWIYQYRENGERGLMATYTKYDFQFKMDVLNYMNENGASLYEKA
jgi:transposase